MNIIWRYPLLLAATPVLSLVLVFLWRQARAHSGRWKAVCLGLPLAAALSALLASAGPVGVSNPAARSVVVMLDLSPAARTAPWNHPAWLRDTLQKHLPTGTRVTLVGFCRHAHRLATDLSLSSSDRWPKRWPRITGTCGNIGRALHWNDDQLAGAPRWVFTAGLVRWPNVDAARETFPLALSIVPPQSADAGITSLRVITTGKWVTVPNKESVRILRVGVAVTSAMRVTLEVKRDGLRIASVPLQFDRAGGRVVEVRNAATGTDQAVRYTVHLRSHDAWPEDDAAAAFVTARSAPRILLIQPKLASTPNAIHGTVTITPAALPTNLAGLADYQEIILDNVPREDFPPGAGRLIARCVRRSGGGLLICGTNHAFGPGDYALGGADKQSWALQRIDPLASLPPNRPPRQFVFLLDASGSMGQTVKHGSGQTRFAMAGQAVAQAISLLRDQDHLAVLAFSGQTVPLITGNVREYRGKINSLLNRVEPSGPTNPDSALPQLERMLTHDAMLMLLTDGRIPRLRVMAWAALLRRRQVHLAIIAPAGGSVALAALARQVHVRRLSGANPWQWAGVMRRSIYRRLAGRVMRETIDWQSIPAGFSGSTHDWDQVWLKKGARLLAATNADSHALTASWRYGLGKVAAVAFTDDSPAYGNFLHPLLRRLLAPSGDRRFHVRCMRRGNYWRLRVDARDDKGFIDAASLKLNLLYPRDERLESSIFTQIAPGRYQLSLPSNIRVFSGIITRLVGRRSVIVARVAPAELPARCYPATAKVEPCPWRQVVRIDTAKTAAASRWKPHVRQWSWDLAPIFWLASATLALAAMWLRR